MTKSTLKELRTTKKMTQQELSHLTGISVRTIARYEKDTKKLRRAKYEKLKGIAQALAVSVDDIFFRNRFGIYELRRSFSVCY
ncbi:helix-turn-helix family protein [Streptococcus pyogenes]|nr:helix-turn-helix family protein [Streptococcus pyogenes]SUO72404.1 helix-turn-helix family protein [Streptococcus pyogenes]VGQ88341.1 helix-turn-helix family protein [Streptococcus pyogenes]VGR20868.1 helix-turn-helix family protein [Streptococcus pyogenes]VGR28345.1 helix-turn-helix family protein [Streptococcus pyogenes]